MDPSEEGRAPEEIGVREENEEESRMKRAAVRPDPSGVKSARAAGAPPVPPALHSQEVPPYDNGLAGSELFRLLSAQTGSASPQGSSLQNWLWADEQARARIGTKPPHAGGATAPPTEELVVSDTTHPRPRVLLGLHSTALLHPLI